MSAWQPIESAPRDGTRVLAFFPRPGSWKKTVIIEWCHNRYEAAPNWTLDDGESATLTYDVPTHWQPLPDPPRAEPVTRLFAPQAAVAPREMPALGWDEALVTG